MIEVDPVGLLPDTSGESPMKTIVVANQKGGCGKTTTAVNLAGALTAAGDRVLLVDLDPQGHATLGLGVDPGSLGQTMYEVMVEQGVAVRDICRPTGLARLTLAPSNNLLAAADLELRRELGKELVLGEKLRPVGEDYDYCVIDCPPLLSLLMINALVAGDYAVVTVQTQYYALEGLKRLLETVQVMRERFHPCRIRTLGLILTFVEDRVALSRQIQQQLRDFFGQLVFDTVVHRNVRLAEAPSAGESIVTYAPSSKGAKEYRALADEIKARIQAVGGDCT
jgi:chromosome partitioning protein